MASSAAALLPTHSTRPPDPVGAAAGPVCRSDAAGGVRPTRRVPGRIFSGPPFGLPERRLGRLFDEAFDEAEELGWMPATEVTESEDEIVLTAEVPGMSRADVQIEVEGDVLRIHGEKREEKEREEEQDGKVRGSERRYGAFSRSFTLPGSIDAGKISAEMKNGVLTVRLPKTEMARGRRVEISGG